MSDKKTVPVWVTWLYFGFGIVWGVVGYLAAEIIWEARDQHISQWGVAVRFIRISNPDLPPIIEMNKPHAPFWITVPEYYFIPKEAEGK